MSIQDFHFQDCAVRLEDSALTVQNSVLSRSWEVGESGLRPVSLRRLPSGENLLDAGSEEAILPVRPQSAGSLLKTSLDAHEDDDLGFAAPHLLCELTLEYAICEIKYRFEIYPKLPLLRSRIFIRSLDRPELLPEAALDLLPLSDLHVEWEAVFLRAVTDSCNNLVQIQRGIVYPAETARLSAGILRLHRTLSGDGLFVVKEAPGGTEQIRYGGYDFVLEGSRCRAVCAGFEPSDLFAGEFVPLYGCAVGFYSGGDLEFYKALRGYHEARHLFRRGFDGAVVSNTWGDANRAANVNEEFLLRDIRAAHALGITHYQIDAGWDTGRHAPGYLTNRWELNTKNLPNGFANILARIRENGMQLGLWLVPHCDDGHNYDYYKTDAESIAAMYHEYGATFFKLDGFKLLNYTAAWRLEEMMRLVLEKTGRSVYFNLDITNWPRTGFFGGTQYANFFLANRYTDWKNYYTHYTQKNLWQLCRYIPAYRIQAECLNTGRNASLYEERLPGDPLAPQKSGQGYALASVLGAAPLAWFEPCEMSGENSREFAELLQKVEPARGEMVASLVLPIGGCPNGVRFTGFQMITGGKSGYLLLLKGKNAAARAPYTLYPGSVDADTGFDRIAANGDSGVAVTAPDTVSVELCGEFRYALYRYHAKA